MCSLWIHLLSRTYVLWTWKLFTACESKLFPTGSYLRTEPTTVSKGARPMDLGRYRKMNVWGTSKSGQTANGGWQHDRKKGSVDIWWKSKRSTWKKPACLAGFFSPPIFYTWWDRNGSGLTIIVKTLTQHGKYHHPGHQSSARQKPISIW